MDNFFYFLQQFSNRDAAILIWLFILTIFIFVKKETRRSLLNILKFFILIKHLSVIIAAIGYTILIIFILIKVTIWDWMLLKETIYWFICVACVLIVNTFKVTQENDFFFKILKDNLKITLLVEFTVNFYTFNLFTEIFLIPAIVFLVGIHTLSGSKKEYALIKNFLDFIFLTTSIFLIIFALANMLIDFQNFVSLQNLKTFILSPILTIAFIPFIYFFALIMTYESLFIRIDHFYKHDRDLIKFAKYNVIRFSHFNLYKLNKFSRFASLKLFNIQNEEEIIFLMNEYKKSL